MSEKTAVRAAEGEKSKRNNIRNAVYNSEYCSIHGGNRQ